MTANTEMLAHYRDHMQGRHSYTAQHLSYEEAIVRAKDRARRALEQFTRAPDGRFARPARANDPILKAAGKV